MIPEEKIELYIEENFKYQIGEVAKIDNCLSVFNERECIIEDRWYSERSKTNKYHVWLGGCNWRYFWEKDLVKL